MKALTLPKTLGTIEDSEREAIFLAIEKKRDVIYVFNTVKHKITLAEARDRLPELMTEALADLGSLKTLLTRRLDSAQKGLIRIAEAMKKV